MKFQEDYLTQAKDAHRTTNKLFLLW